MLIRSTHSAVVVVVEEAHDLSDGKGQGVIDTPFGAGAVAKMTIRIMTSRGWGYLKDRGSRRVVFVKPAPHSIPSITEYDSEMGPTVIRVIVEES